MNALDSKYSKTVEDAAQAAKELCMRVTLLESLLEAEEDSLASFQKAGVDENAKV